MCVVDGEPLSEAQRGICLIRSIPGALCVEALMDGSGGGVSRHVIICVWMDNGVGITGMIMEDASEMNGWWCGEKEGYVWILNRGDGCE